MTDNINAYIRHGRDIISNESTLYDVTVASELNCVKLGTVAVGGKESSEASAETAVDASVALLLVNNSVNAVVDNISLKPVKLTITAEEGSMSTLCQASVFAVGSEAAVGATAAALIVDSDIHAEFRGTAVCSGEVKIKSSSAIENESTDSVASATGASAKKAVDKASKAVSNGALSDEAIENIKDDMNGGDYSYINNAAAAMDAAGDDKYNNGNATAKLINEFLGKLLGVDLTSVNLSTSINILKAFAATTEGTGGSESSSNGGGTSESDEIAKEISDAVTEGNTESGSENPAGKDTGRTLQIAGSVAVTYTDRDVSTLMYGDITGKTIEIRAGNQQYSRARATGAATGKDNSNDIALAVAINIIGNDQHTDVSGILTTTGTGTEDKPDLVIESVAVINMNGKYNTAQAIGGSFCSGDSKVTITGAVTIVKAAGVTLTEIHNGTEITGTAVKLLADNKSKLALRAGGISKTSKGATVGAGLSFALLYDDSATMLIIGDRAAAEDTDSYLADRVVIRANTVDIRALKERIEWTSDNLTGLISTFISVKSDDAIGGASQSGIFNVNLDLSGGGIKTTFSKATGLSLYEAILSSAGYCLEQSNYYVEATGGTISGKGSNIAAQGSAAMLFYNSYVGTQIGDGIRIETRDENSDVAGKVTVAAEDRSRARVIAGSVSVSKPNVGVSAAIGVLNDDSTTHLDVGSNARIVTGEYIQQAIASNEHLVVTVSPSVATGGDTKVNAGGCIDAILIKSDVQNTLGAGSRITAKNGIAISAERYDRALVCAADAKAGTAKTAVGGTVCVIVEKGNALVIIEDGCTLESSSGDVNIMSASSEKLLSVLASLSGAPSDKAGVSATIGVFVTRSNTETNVGNSCSLKGNNVNITADSSAYMMPLNIAFSISGAGQSAGLGFRGSVLVDIYDRTASALVGEGTNVTALGTANGLDGNIVVRAGIYDWNLVVAGTFGADGQGTAFSATVPVVISKNKALALVGYTGSEKPDSDILDSTLAARDTVAVVSDIDSMSFVIAGEAQFSYKSADSVGAVAVVTARSDEARAIAGDFVRIQTTLPPESATGISLPGSKKNDTRKGVVVSADIRDRFFQCAATASAGAGTAKKAAVDTIVLQSCASSRLGRTRETATQSDTGHHISGSDIYVGANDDTYIITVVASAAVNSGAGTDALGSVLVAVFNKEASAVLDGDAEAAGSIAVVSGADDELYFISGAAAASRQSIDGDASVVIFRDSVTSVLKGNVINSISVLIEAENATKLYNIGGTLAVSASGAGGTGVVIVTYFEGSTLAYTEDAVSVKTSGDPEMSLGNLTVNAISSETISADAVAVGAGASAQVSGVIDILVSSNTTEAFIGDNNSIDISGILTVYAEDTFDLFVVAGSAAAAENAGITVTGLVVVQLNTTSSQIGKTSDAGTSISADCVIVKAMTTRDMFTTVGTIGVAGSVSVPVSATVLVSGASMNQDAYDMLFGNSNLKPQSISETALSDGGRRSSSIELKTSLDDVIKGDALNMPTDLDTPSDKDKELLSGSTPGESVSHEADSASSARDLNSEETSRYDGVYSGIEDISFKPKNTNDSLKDATSAIIKGGVTVNHTNGVDVEAYDLLSMLSITGAIGGSGTAAVGVGISVATLNSNVAAIIEKGAVIKAVADNEDHISPDADVRVLAGTGASLRGCQAPVIQKTQGSDTGSLVQTQDAIKDELKQLDEAIGIDADSNKLMLIGVSAAFSGSASVAVNGGVMLVYNDVTAQMNGEIQRADSVSVSLTNYYKEVLTISAALAASAGASPALSVAVTYFDLSADASIGPGAKIDGIEGQVSVSSNGSLKSQNVSGAGGAGTAGIAGAVSVYVNDSEINTFIAPGAKIVFATDTAGGKDVSVTTDYSSDSNVLNIDFAVGYAGIGAGVAVSVNRLSAYTYVGVKDDTNASDAYVSVKNASDFEVSSNLTGDTTVRAAGLAAGAVGVNALVSIGVNRVTGIARVSESEIDADDLRVLARLTGNVLNTPLSVAGGAVGVGAVVAIGKQMSVNRAELVLSKPVNITGSITVSAGACDETLPHGGFSYSDVTVTAGSGVIGAVGVHVNVVIAINNAVNEALIKGGELELNTAGDITVGAYGYAFAYAVALSGSVDAADCGVSVAIAKITATQRAKISADCRIAAGSLCVISRFNDVLPAESDTWKVFSDEGFIQGEKDCTVKALIITANASLVRLTVHTAIAMASATNVAKIETSSLKVDNAITLSSSGISDASADSMDESIGFADVGIVVAYAYADGDFESVILNSGNITAGSADISNTYISKATSEITPTGLGASVSAADVYLNIGFAKVRTSSDAGIEGGYMTVNSGDLKILNNGTTASNVTVNPASFKAGAVSLGANIAMSTLETDQKAYIADASVKVPSGDISVINSYNVDNAETGDDSPNMIRDTGAYVNLGTSYGEVSLATVSANVGEAANNSNVTSFIVADSIDAKGKVDVKTVSADYAQAGVVNPGLEVNAVEAAVNVTKAHSKGRYEAYISANGGELTASDFNVNAFVFTDAVSEIAPNGGKACKIGALDVAVNSTEASVDTGVVTGLRGNGRINATSGNVIVKSKVTGEVESLYIPDYSIDFAIADVSGLNAESNMKANLLTDIDLHSLSVSAANDIQIISDSLCGCDAIVGSIHGFKIAGVSVEGLAAKANSEVSSIINVTGATGSLDAGKNVSIVSTTKSDAHADTSCPSEASGFGEKTVLSQANVTDNNEINISCGKITAGEKVSVKAQNNPVSDAEGTTGHSVSIADFSSSNVLASIGCPNTADPEKIKYDTVKIDLQSGTDIVAGGSISVDAENRGTVHAANHEGFKITALDADMGIVPAYAYHKTTINVASNLESKGGNIDIYLPEYSDLEATVDANSVGILLDASKKYASTVLVQDSEINIGDGLSDTLLKAKGNVNISGLSAAREYAETNLNAAGIVTGGEVQSNSSLDRNMDINVKSKAKIEGDSVQISIENGTKDGVAYDTIYAFAKGEAAGFANCSSATAKMYYHSLPHINIENGTVIDSDKDLEITVDNSPYLLNVAVDSKGEGVYGEAKSKAFFNDDHKTGVAGTIDIGMTGDGRTQLSGKNVNIRSGMDRMFMDCYAFHEGEQGINVMKIEADAYLEMLFNINIGSADIDADELLSVLLDVNPELGLDLPENEYAEAAHVHARGHAYVDVSGHVYSYLRKGNTGFTTTIGSEANLGGKQIDINNEGFGELKSDETTFGGKSYSKAEMYIWDCVDFTTKEEVNEFLRNGTDGRYTPDSAILAVSDIEDGATFNIKSDKEDKNITVNPDGSTVKVDSSDPALCPAPVINDEEKTVELPDLTSSSNGTLQIKRNQNENGITKCTVNVESNIDTLSVTNNSDYSLIFNKVDHNDSSSIKLIDCVNDTIPETVDKGFDIEILSNSHGDVDLRKKMDAGEGDVTVKWSDKTNNGSFTSEGDGEVNAKKLNVINAKDVKIESDKDNSPVSIGEITADNVSIKTSGVNSNINLDTITADNVTLVTQGKIIGSPLPRTMNITSKNLTMSANTGIGDVHNVLDVYVSGNLYAKTRSGIAYYVNHFGPHSDDDTSGDGDTNYNGGAFMLQSDGRWKFRFEDGSYAVNTWIKYSNTYYYFDEDGILQLIFFKDADGSSCFLSALPVKNADGTVECWLFVDGKWSCCDMSDLTQLTPDTAIKLQPADDIPAGHAALSESEIALLPFDMNAVISMLYAKDGTLLIDDAEDLQVLYQGS